MKFDLNDYPERKWVMHCETGEQAEYFCMFLHNAGRTWCTGQSYFGKTSWSPKGGGCCYAFNSGEYSNYDWFKHQSEYEILEFEDFEWEGFHTPQYDTSVIDDFLMGFQTA